MSFDYSVNRTLGFEGGLNPKDTNGTPSLYGINGASNPDVDLSTLTKERARQIYKQRYWDSIDADKLDPKLAHVAFDTSVMAGPEKAKELLAASGGDPLKFMDLREKFLAGLQASDPEKYGKYAGAWQDRNAGLRKDLGLDIPTGNPSTAELPYNPASSAKSALQKYGLIEGAMEALPQITGTKATLPGDDLSQHATTVLGNYGLIPQSINGVNPDPMKTGGAYDSQGHLVTGGKSMTQNADWGVGQMAANGVLGGLGPQVAALAKLAQLKLSGQALPNDAYDQLVSMHQGARDQELAAHPIAAPLAEAAGSVVPAVAAGLGAGAVAKGVGTVAANLAPKAAPAINALGEVLGGTAGGPASSFGFPAGGTGWGNALLSTASRGVSGALQGDLAGHVLGNLETPNDPWNAALGATANMLLGPLGSKVIAPFRASVIPETRDVANRLIDRGVYIRGGQIASSPAIKAMDSAVSPELKTQQLESLTRGFGQTFGADKVMDAQGTKGWTPEVLKEAGATIGKKMDDVTSHVKVNLYQPDYNGQSVYNKIDDIEKSVNGTATDDAAKSKVLKAIEQINKQGIINHNQLDGETYQALTQNKGVVKQLRDDPNPWVQGFGKELHEALLDGFEASAPPEYKGQISDLRAQYMKLQVAKDAMKKGANSGLVDPVELKSAIIRAYGKTPPPEMDAFARAANLGFSRPALESGVKEGTKPSPGLLASLTSHAGPAGIGAGAAMLGEHLGPHLMSAVSSNPLSIGLPVAGAAIGYGANALMNGARRAVMQSPDYTNFLLGGAKVPPLPNPLIGPTTQVRSDLYDK